LRVACGRRETMAIGWPTSALTSVDLPTLGRPVTATKPARKLMSSSFDPGQHGNRRGLLGVAFAGTLATTFHVQLGNAAFALETSHVLGAMRAHQMILRQG